MIKGLVLVVSYIIAVVIYSVLSGLIGIYQDEIKQWIRGIIK